MNNDNHGPRDSSSPGNFGTNGDAAGHQRLRAALEPGSPGNQTKAAPSPAGQEATESEIVAFSNIGHYRVNPKTSALEVRPGVHPDALKAVESFQTQSETNTVIQDGDTITTTTTTTKIVLRDKIAALEEQAGFVPTAGPASPPSSSDLP